MIHFGSQHKFDTFVEKFIARLGTQPELVEVYSTPNLKFKLITKATNIIHTPTDQGDQFKKTELSTKEKEPEFFAS